MSAPQAALQPLATRCVELADHRGRTPVVVVDRELELAPEFYAALATELRAAAGRAPRLEFLVELEGTLSPWRARSAVRRVHSVRRALEPVLGDAAAVESRTVLSRPAGPNRPLVVGFATAENAVPGWAAIIHLTCRPRATDDFQLIPAAA